MKTAQPLISVVIPHLNQPEQLEFCLRSLEEQTLPSELFEVIIVDNGSDSIPQAPDGRLPIRVMRELTPGPGAARNHGAAFASGDILAFIDADCRSDRDWLKAALRTMASAPARTILGGDVRILRKDAEAFSAIEAYESVFAYRFQFYIEKRGFCGTGNLIVRRTDFYEIGLFAGIGIAEDVEWGQRARARGYTFRYVPEMIVYHPARKSLKDLCVKWDRLMQHALNMARTKRGWRLNWVARAFAILLSPAFDWTKVVTSDRLQGTLARLKAVAVLIAIRAYRFERLLALSFFSKEVAWNRNVVTSDGGRRSNSQPSNLRKQDANVRGYR